MSKHSRANVRHEIAQQDRREAKRKPRKPKPVPLCRGCLARGVRARATYALMGDRLNCCETCWNVASETKPLLATAVLLEGYGIWSPSRNAPVALAKRDCKHCYRPIMSDEDHSDQVTLYGCFTGICEACFRSPALHHEDIVRYMAS